jgi:hypothetical protein
MPFDMDLVSRSFELEDSERTVIKTIETKKFVLKIDKSEVEALLRPYLVEKLGQSLPSSAVVEIEPSIDWRNEFYEGFDLMVEIPVEEIVS